MTSGGRPRGGLPVDLTRHRAWPAWRDALRAAAPSDDDAARRQVLVGLVGALADVDGWDPRTAGLRLGPTTAPAARTPSPRLPPVPAGLLGPDLLGAAHEALLDPATRRAAAVHYTPAPLASALVAWALGLGRDEVEDAPRDVRPDRRREVDDPTPGPSDVDHPGHGPGGPLRVVDLAVGGGAFLLAVARHQRAAGRAAGEVVAGLSGVDLDPLAVGVAEATLVAWARSEGWDGKGPGPTLVVAEGTDPDPLGAAGPQRGAVDLVVGNPPFRSQLGRATARDAATARRLRADWGEGVAGYVDDAAVFLRVACAWPRAGGRVVLVLPESVLGARDAAGVREAVTAEAELVGLWVAGEAAFAAAVDVCAPVLEVRAPGRVRPSRQVARADGVDVRPGPPQPQPSGASWAPLLARRRGVPRVRLDPGGGSLGDLVRATAGFRQHFYALVPHLGEAPPGGEAPGTAPVLTTGLVDPLALDWGRRPARIGGRTWSCPAVDVGAVEADAPEVGAWLRARLRPKVVVAPQTRVVETAVDAAGRFVPGVPLVAVEPRDEVTPRGLDPDDPDLLLWLVVAALSAPPVTAWAMEQAAGTARHRDALRLPPRQVLDVPLPADRGAWAGAARALRAGRALSDVGPDLAVAHGLDPDDPVVAWWRSRLPRLRPGAAGSR